VGETLQELLEKTTTTTADIAGTKLNEEQSEEFIKGVFQAVPMLQEARSFTMKADQYRVPKIGIGQRKIRAADENVAPTVLAKADYGSVPLTSHRIILPWELTRDVLEDIVGKEEHENVLFQQMAEALGVDLDDLYWNGDTTLEDDPLASGYVEGNEALTILNGWLQQLDTGSHILDGSAINSGAISKTHFKSALNLVPNKFITAANAVKAYRWIMNPRQVTNWRDYLADRNTGLGDAALLGSDSALAPFGYRILEDPAMPVGTIVLGIPKNFIIGLHRDITFDKTSEGKDLVSRGARYYQFTLRVDCAIEEKDACVKIEGLDA